jgi:hypothetical protein
VEGYLMGHELSHVRQYLALRPQVKNAWESFINDNSEDFKLLFKNLEEKDQLEEKEDLEVQREASKCCYLFSRSSTEKGQVTIDAEIKQLITNLQSNIEKSSILAKCMPCIITPDYLKECYGLYRSYQFRSSSSSSSSEGSSKFLSFLKTDLKHPINLIWSRYKNEDWETLLNPLNLQSSETTTLSSLLYNAEEGRNLLGVSHIGERDFLEEVMPGYVRIPYDPNKTIPETLEPSAKSLVKAALAYKRPSGIDPSLPSPTSSPSFSSSSTSNPLLIIPP